MPHCSTLSRCLRARAFRTWPAAAAVGMGLWLLISGAGAPLAAEDSAAATSEPLPLLVQEDFESGADRWQPTDPKAWRIEPGRGGHVYSQFVKASNYKPPHRSPYNIALLKDVIVGDFELTAKVRSTIPDYGHRDACLFFGYQDPANFYYVHLGKQADDHANQIFIVHDAPRTKISTRTTKGTPWSDDWHAVRIVRRVADGTIEVYFDDMENPAMTASDKTFVWGQVGVGSFDDTTQWDDVQLRGRLVERPPADAPTSDKSPKPAE